MDAAQPSERTDRGRSYFNTTHWSTVQSARDGESEPAAQALAQLCSCYWYPLYSFVRRRGLNHHDAEDLTQAFFHRLLDRNYLSAVDFRKGRFRTFLLMALERFMANEWRRAQAQKRGGQVAFVSLDEPAAEHRYLQEPAPGLSPENVYDQNCALALLERALLRLRREFEADGKAEKFDRLKGFLTTDGEQTAYAVVAEQTQDTVAALKMAVSRLRARYGELLREEVANTLSSTQEVEDELNALLIALSY